MAIRLRVQASGREHAGKINDTILSHSDLDFVPQLPDANDSAAVRTYTETYTYDLLGNLIAKVDILAIGGGMANTFLAAQGRPIGRSLAERDLVGTAREIVAAADAKGREIVLPTDASTGTTFSFTASSTQFILGGTKTMGTIVDQFTKQ